MGGQRGGEVGGAVEPWVRRVVGRWGATAETLLDDVVSGAGFVGEDTRPGGLTRIALGRDGRFLRHPAPGQGVTEAENGLVAHVTLPCRSRPLKGPWWSRSPSICWRHDVLRRRGAQWPACSPSPPDELTHAGRH